MQNSADRTQTPGKDGGCPQKVLAGSSGPSPAPHAQQSPFYPSAHGGWIGQACRIFAVRCCLFGRIADADPLTGLVSATQAIVPRRRQPIWQDREGLLARPTDSAPHPNACAPIIVALTKAPAVADDRIVMAKPDSAAAKVPAGLPRI